MSQLSPSGKVVCKSSGPLDAKIVLIGESPAGEEMLAKPVPTPLVGPSGRMLNKVLVKAGIDRSQCYVMNCIPVRAPGDKFAHHDPRDVDFGRSEFHRELASLHSAKVFVPLGANPTEWLLGGRPPVAQRGENKREGFIGSWRGSVIPLNTLGASYRNKPEDYLSRLPYECVLDDFNTGAVVIPTFHPAAVLRQFNWHPWFLLDLQRVAEIAQNGLPAIRYRQWYRNDPQALRRLANDQPDLFALDSELDPWIVSIVTDDEVHVFEWNESFRRPLEDLLHSNAVKIAHRWLHDWAFLRKCLEIEASAPLFDLIGGAVALNTSLEKQLSPHISTRFTWWPYHKWLTNVDQLTYCGMDSVVAFDAYRPMMQELIDRRLYVIASLNQSEVDNSVVAHDHKLLMPLLHMQAKGFKIDEETRLVVSEELKAKLEAAEKDLAQSVEPIVERSLSRFVKPHLFRVDRQCECCGGGKTQREHCYACHVLNCDCFQTIGKITKEDALAHQFKTIKAFKASWPMCELCKGSGKIVKKLEFNSDSSDQIADVIYRGLHIRPRKFKGKETVKAAQLDPIKDKHPVIAQIVNVSEIRAEYDTVHRLRAGSDGLLHCEFDPWGAETRVASKEGLLEAGTNAQNLPKEARRFVVPRDGYTFLYPDLAQVEARAMAVLSGDKNLRKALYETLPDLGKPDYHTWLLRAIMDCDNSIQLSRDQSKRVSYAGFYGARPEQLAKELTAEAFRKGVGQQVDSKMAQRILDTLYRVCPEVPRWQQSACDEVLRTRRLKSPTGREFAFNGYILDDKKPTELDYEVKKQVYSRLPQDMGAWILGLGLIDIWTSGEWGKLLMPLIHVHDAILIEVPSDRTPDAEALAQKYLTRVYWNMDFPVDMKRGENWYACS